MIGGSVFADASGHQWYVFADWAKGCMITLPIKADHTLDLARGEPLQLGVSPARIRNVDGRMLIVDVALGAVRVTDGPLIGAGDPPPGIGRWIGIGVALGIIVCLGAIFIVRRRAAQHRRSRLKVAGSVADGLVHELAVHDQGRRGDAG